MYGQQYNPYTYANPYQQRLAQLEQPIYQQHNMQNQQMLKGRVVGSVDEAKAAQVDLDGSVTYFASPGEGKIYAKSIGLNGLPVFTVYVAQQMPVPVNNEFAALAERVKKLEEALQNVSATTNADAHAQQ